jgi:hypothetical protein
MVRQVELGLQMQLLLGQQVLIRSHPQRQISQAKQRRAEAIDGELKMSR